MIQDKIAELKNVITLLKENTEKEIREFPVLTPEEILDCATTKDRLMKEFIIVKSELDVLMHNKSQEEIELFTDLFVDLENEMIIFKDLNKKLLMLTVPIQEMYNNLHEKMKNSQQINTKLLSKTI